MQATEQVYTAMSEPELGPHPSWCHDRGCKASVSPEGFQVGWHATSPLLLTSVYGQSVSTVVSIEAGDWKVVKDNKYAFVELRIEPNDDIPGDEGQCVMLCAEEARLLARHLIRTAEHLERLQQS